jgi:hypothetical protein
VLLQPTTTMEGELKYEMRIIAQNVEYYALMRDHPSFNLELKESSHSPSGLMISGVGEYQGHDLRDSLWYFDGHDVRVWIDVQDVLATASAELGRDLFPAVKIPVDFYPLSTLLNKGTLFGVETDLVQRRDVNFAYFRFATRVSFSHEFPQSSMAREAPSRKGKIHFLSADMSPKITRRTCSSPPCSGTISRDSTRLQPYTSRTTTRTWSTSRTRSKSCCTTC